jgi:PadR family transcriptional regulator, regulatory protein PadR
MHHSLLLHASPPYCLHHFRWVEWRSSLSFLSVSVDSAGANIITIPGMQAVKNDNSTRPVRPGKEAAEMARRNFLWTLKRSRDIFFAMTKGTTAGTNKSEVLQGTLDLMILKTLHALGPLHGFGIARRIEQVSGDVLKLNEGTVYTSLLRLQQQGWIDSEWGASENNRKARFYSITRRGLNQLAAETENWERISGVIGRVLRLEGQK